MSHISEEDESSSESDFDEMHRAGLEGIDASLPLQIFPGLYQKMLETITIKIKKKLGKGGFGQVNLVEVKELNNERVVDKIPLNQNEDSMMMIYREFKLVQNLNGHPHIVDYKYFMRQNQESHLIMEYVKGGDMQKYMKNHK